MTTFVDTNIFLRFLTNDDPEKAAACLELFRLADSGNIVLTTSEAVIAEVVFVLSSPRLYGLSRAEVRERLYPLITLRGLKLSDPTLYIHALELYATLPIDFEDALSASHMCRQGIAEIYSYDSDFERIADIRRIEP